MKTVLAVLALVAVALARPAEEVVEIISQDSDIHPDGHYNYNFESGNGIKASQEGELKVVDKDAEAIVSRGSYEYKGDDGETYSITYVADENGYQPQGAHLPVAPAIPEAIQRALAFLATATPPVDGKY